MLLLQRFLDFIRMEKLFQPSSRLLLAVSGGVDSVVMTALCRQAGFDITIAHCNFQLRGAESLRDEQFVCNMANRLGIVALVKQFDTATFAQENKLSVQVAARELRYRWFNELVSKSPSAAGKEMEEESTPLYDSGNAQVLPGPYAPVSPQQWDHEGKGFDCMLTAHHLNDNIETMMMNFFKGTGIAGMRGMLPRNGLLIRPLLFAAKHDILQFAEENGLPFVEDSSNASDKYTRNYFRNQLIPAVQSVYPRVEDNLAKNLQLFREAEQLYHQSIGWHKKHLMETKAGEVHIPVLKLKKTIPLDTVVYEIIKAFGFTPHQVKEVIDLLDSGSGKFVPSDSHWIIKNRNWLIISPHPTVLSAIKVIRESDHTIHFTGGTLEIKEVPAANCTLSTSAFTAQLDANSIRFPLLLRKPGQGDYFYPLGMQKKKKLNRFLSDLKLSVIEKENTWVLEMDKKIIWIPGRRIDDRFKLTPHTRRVCQIRFTATGL